MENLWSLLLEFYYQVKLKVSTWFARCRVAFAKAWESYLKRYLKLFWLGLRFTLALVAFLVVTLSLLSPTAELITLPYRANVSPDTTLKAEQLKLEKALDKEISQLERRMNAFTPIYPFMIINTTENKFFVYKGQKLMMEGKCSTGSYINLVADSTQNWIFKTPRGVRRIHGKTTYPVWRKPDWAFVEEGLPIPSPLHHTRFEYGVLGDYALSLGDGYLIHGTIYKRQLGMPVTHGCVRLNDEDLEYIYRTLEIGSRVYIY